MAAPTAVTMAIATIAPEKRSGMGISSRPAVTATPLPDEPKLPGCGLGRVYRGSVRGEMKIPADRIGWPLRRASTIADTPAALGLKIGQMYSRLQAPLRLRQLNIGHL